MNFIIDDQKHIRIFLSGIYSSSLVSNQCVFGMTNQGIILVQNAQNFEQLVCLRDQCHIISFNEEMFGSAQIGVPLSCFMSNGHLDKQAISKNIKLNQCFIDLNLDMITKPLRALESSIKKLQIQLGYKVNGDQLVKKLALQLCINCFLIDGSIYEQALTVKELTQIDHILYVYNQATEVLNNNLLLLCFDHKLGQELKMFNQDEGLDLQLDKEYVKVVPVLTQSDLTFNPIQFIDYKFGKICEDYGWIKHLLIDPNFIIPVQFMMRKHDLNGQLLLNRKREKKMGFVYFYTCYQKYMFSMSTSTSVISLYDENATELDMAELNQVVETVELISSQQQQDSNSKLLVNDSNFSALDSGPKKFINFGRLEPQKQEIHLRYVQFAEEQSRNIQFIPKSSDEVRRARLKLFDQNQEESKINKSEYQK